MTKLDELRAEIAELRKEVAALRADRTVHHYHHQAAPTPFAPQPWPQQPGTTPYFPQVMPAYSRCVDQLTGITAGMSEGRLS